MPLKALEEDGEESRRKLNVSEAVARVLSKLEGIFTLKEEQKPSLKAFPSGHLVLFYPKVAFAKI